MPKSFNLAAVKDPRVVMRVIIGTLLAANLAAAVITFKPFGGSATDLREQAERGMAQLSQLQARLATSKQLVEKVQKARRDEDQFLATYFMDVRTHSTTIVEELTRAAAQAGIKQLGTAQFNRDPIEGSDSLVMMSAQAGFEGTYANLTKFVNLLDKSPRFLIIESMQAAAPQAQGGQTLSVTFKIDAFVKDSTGAAL